MRKWQNESLQAFNQDLKNGRSSHELVAETNLRRLYNEQHSEEVRRSGSVQQRNLLRKHQQQIK